MTNLNFYRLFLSISTVLIGFIGCVRTDPPAPENYAKFPLDVKADVLADGSFRLQWNAIKSADFIEYQIIRNIGDSVPFITDNTVMLSSISRNMEVIKRIGDADSTSFIDATTIPVAKTHLRVFAVLKNRNLSNNRSFEMPISAEVKEMNLAPTDIIFVPEDKKLVISDQTTNQLGIYDTGLNAPFGSLILSSFINGGTEMSYGRFNGVSEFYTLNFNIIRRFFNNNSTSSLTSLNSAESVMHDNNLGIYLVLTAQPPIIRSYSRAATTSSFIAQTQFANPPRQQLFYTFRPAPLNREGIAVSVTNGSSDLIWFTYSADGRTITQLKNLNTTTLPITKRPFVIAPDNQSFITSNKGLIFNRNMVITDSLKNPTSDARYTDMIFSNDKTRLFALRGGTSDRKEKFVDVYKFPNFQFEKTIGFRSTPTRLFQDDTYLVLVGPSPNNTKFTMIEKVKW